jgi:hypothetical protein
MNEARRSLLKSLPFTAMGAYAATATTPEAKASVAEVASPDRKDTRVVFAFRLNRPAPQAAIDNLRTEVRSMLDAHGFSGALAFVLPEYLELDVFEIEGANNVRDRNS